VFKNPSSAVKSTNDMNPSILSLYNRIGYNGQEYLPFNRKKPTAEPETGRMAICHSERRLLHFFI